LRHSATLRKVVGSIPDGVIGLFHWINPFGRTVALISTQPVTIEYQRSSLGGKGGRCVGLTTLPPSCTDCLEVLGTMAPLQPMAVRGVKNSGNYGSTSANGSQGSKEQWELWLHVSQWQSGKWRTVGTLAPRQPMAVREVKNSGNYGSTSANGSQGSEEQWELWLHVSQWQSDKWRTVAL
jgi:hypothetical protein